MGVHNAWVTMLKSGHLKEFGSEGCDFEVIEKKVAKKELTFMMLRLSVRIASLSVINILKLATNSQYLI